MQNLNPRRLTLKALTAAVALTGLSALPCPVGRHHQGGHFAQPVWYQAVSVTVLKDTILMAIDDINARWRDGQKTGACDCGSSFQLASVC